MYEQAFGFTEKPFSLLPDPGFLYLSKKHTAASAMLEYGILNQAGFSVVTGDVGCGKTTLVRYLLGKMEYSVTVGLVTNTHASLGDLLQLVMLAFGLEPSGQEKIERLRMFTKFVTKQYENHKKVVLIIDEAQHMDVSKLEELRMLSNINVDKDMVLQVILIGQPELRDVLSRPELLQFTQRLMVNFHLGPLSLTETKEYILHRLRVAGGKTSIFRQDCFDVIYRYTAGVPRLINIVCDTALSYAFGVKRKTVDARTIEQVLRDRARDQSYTRPESGPDVGTRYVHALTRASVAGSLPLETEEFGELRREEFDIGDHEVLDDRIRRLLQNSNAELGDLDGEPVLGDMERVMLRELFLGSEGGASSDSDDHDR